MIITLSPYLPHIKVDKLMKTISVTMLEGKMYDFSPYTITREHLPDMVKKKADFDLKKKAEAMNADAILNAHYIPYTARLDGGNRTDDSYALYAYGTPVKFEK